MKPLPGKAAIFVAPFAVVSLVLIVKAAVAASAIHDYWQFAAYMAVASFAARFRVSIPRMTSSMAVNLPFILLAALELSLIEALAIAAVSTFVQCFWPESKQRNPIQIVFNVAVLVVGTQLASMVSRLSFRNTAWQIMAATTAILVANTVPVATVIGLSEDKRIWETWMRIVQLTFPYYMVTAGLAALVKLADHAVGWQIPLLVLPATLLMYCSFSAYFRHMPQSASLPKAMAARAM